MAHAGKYTLIEVQPGDEEEGEVSVKVSSAHGGGFTSCSHTGSTVFV